MLWSYWNRRPAPSPWAELERLATEMHRVFESRAPSGAPESPPVNLWVNEDGALALAQVPGVAAEDLDVSVVGDTLTIQGTRAAPEGMDGQNVHRAERASGRFVRTFQLPFEVEAGEVEARVANGLMEVRLPRAQAERPRKITVKAS